MKVSHGSAISLGFFLYCRLWVRPGFRVGARADPIGSHIVDAAGCIAWRAGSSIARPRFTRRRFAPFKCAAQYGCRAGSVSQPGAIGSGAGSNRYPNPRVI